MFVYYKLYRKLVYSTISTPLCGDQEKNGSPQHWGCARDGKKRSSLFKNVLEQTSSLSAGQ